MALDDRREPNRTIHWCHNSFCFNWIYEEELYTEGHAGWLFYRGWVYCPECQKTDQKTKDKVIKAKFRELQRQEKKRYRK